MVAPSANVACCEPQAAARFDPVPPFLGCQASKLHGTASNLVSQAKAKVFFRRSVHARESIAASQKISAKAMLLSASCDGEVSGNASAVIFTSCPFGCCSRYTAMIASEWHCSRLASRPRSNYPESERIYFCNTLLYHT